MKTELVVAALAKKMAAAAAATAASASASSGGAKRLMNKLDNYIIVDIGANLTNKKFSRDLDAVIGRAKEAGMVHCSRLKKRIYVLVPFFYP